MKITSLFWNKEERRFTALLRILFFLVIASLLSLPLALLGDSMNEFVEKSFTNVLVMIAMLLAIFISGSYLDKRRWSEFGITLLPFGKFVSGFGLGALLMVLIFGIQYVLGWIELREFNFNRISGYAFGLVFLGQLIRYFSGSIFEEAFTRGYLLLNIAEGFNGLLSRRNAVMTAYILSSSLFGILHLGNDHASLLSTLNLILIGLLFGWTVIQSGKLHFAIGLHMSWNVFQNNIFGAANSGKMPVASLMTFENSGSSLWTGGDFGPEGGLICTLVISIYLLIEILRNQGFQQKILR